MLTSQTVSSHLPFLRRYARALTGSQESGDKYVEAALSAVVDQPDLVEDRTAVRVEIASSV
jgi:DNA-directed RNA polymerase specialized sigma24 family protein